MMQRYPDVGAVMFYGCIVSVCQWFVNSVRFSVNSLCTRGDCMFAFHQGARILQRSKHRHRSRKPFACPELCHSFLSAPE